MAKRGRISLALAIVVIISSSVYAADEQWLQYRTSKEPWRVNISVAYQNPVVLTEAPEGVKLPEKIGPDMRLVKWETPMAKEGFLWLAFARSQKDGSIDQLYIDSNADGSLADETPITGLNERGDSCDFGLVKVVFPTGDGPVTYHARVIYTERGDSKRPYIAAGCWYEGKVKVGGKDYECALVDYNGNGAFNDTSMDLEKCDTIRIGGREAPQKHFGKYLDIDGKLYHPQPAPDGASIKFEEAVNVPMGTIVVGDKISSLIIAGENGQIDFEVKEGKVQAPAGRWIVDNWGMKRQDTKGGQWSLGGRGFPESGIFEVAEGKETALDIGEPATSRLDVRKNNREYNFSESLTGKSGERVSLSMAGSQPPAPKLRIKNADGSYDRTFQFQYG